MFSRNENNWKVIPNSVFAEVPDKYELSKEQFKFYEDNGYLVVKKLIDFESLYSYKRRFQQICNGVVPRGNMTMQKDKKLMESGKKPEDYVQKLQDIAYDDVFSLYLEHPALLAVVAQCLGRDLVAMHTMFINKPPGSHRHPPHQDLYYFPFRPAEKIMASWTAVDEVTVDNGCLYVVPGSHNRGRLYEHGYTEKTYKMYHGILDEHSVAPEDSRVNLEMSPGDTVFFHPLLVHGSRNNVTKNYRKSISCHYASSDCHFIDVRGTVQESIADEILQEAKRRGFDNVSFENVWRSRCKTVLGIKSNL